MATFGIVLLIIVSAVFGGVLVERKYRKKEERWISSLRQIRDSIIDTPRSSVDMVHVLSCIISMVNSDIIDIDELITDLETKPVEPTAKKEKYVFR